jgi:polyisoprenoid-binding protein YceI
MRTTVPLCALLLSLSLLTACDEPRSFEERAKAMEGGDPIPAGAAEVQFPWMGKQSIMAVGEAVERQIAFVDFSDKDHAALGTVTLDASGVGKGEIRVRAADLKTGSNDRDEKLRGPTWLDAASHPDLVLALTKLERVHPTVWKATGTWTMAGVTKPVEFPVNVRWIGAMFGVADDGVVRVSGSFVTKLKDHNVGGQWAGTPAVAADWDVNVVLLGVLRKK